MASTNIPTSQGGRLPDDVAIRVDDVSMIFNMASEQLNSLKEYFIKIARRELFFEEFRALNHISFDVKKGEAFGLVGTNGSGKSTMLKCIAGVLEPSEGSITVKGSIAPLIELGAGFDMELTARENIYLNGALLGYTKEFIETHYDDIIDFAELRNFEDMPLKNYSSGMVARIAFAIATITEPDILIVDETLSVGDFLFQEKCERRIRELIESNNVTVLLVSHSIELVERMCDRVCWIEKGQQRMLGPTQEVCDAYKALR
jgi:ABC-2 type transport system ATP-binding protein